MAEELAVVGKAEHLDKQIVEVVTGRLDAADDHLMGMKLFARILGSPHPHCKVVSIDTSKAEALDGVEAVITHEDHPGWTDVKLFWGQEVAAVAAVDEYIAARAIELIDVEYEVRPFVIDPDEAMEPDAPLVGVWPESNIQTRQEVDRGDIEAGFDEADVIIEETVGWTAFFHNNPVEGGNVVAYWNGDHVYEWISSQNVFSARNGLAGSLDLPYNKVHVISHGNGGGFGNGRAPVELTTAVLAKKAGKPVQLHATRQENFLLAGQQHQDKATIRMGAKSDGTLTAIDATFWGDQGSNPRAPVTGVHEALAFTFKCPNAHFRVDGVATNKPQVWYWRCVQHPPGTFLMDIVIEKMAEALDMKPLEFKLKNLVTPDMLDQDSLKPLSKCTMTEVFNMVADEIGFNDKWHAPGTETLADGRLHGIGISGHLDSHGSMSQRRGGIIHLTGDGKCLMNDGLTRTGAGTNSAHAMIVAEKLGLNYEDVMIGDYANTDVCQDCGMQNGSTGTISCGAAFYSAAEDARQQLFEAAAAKFDPPVDPEDLDAREGVIFVKADPTKSMTHTEAYGGAWPIIGRGNNWDKVLKRPVLDWPVETPCEVRAMCCSAAEVAVDTETGEVEILNFVGGDDCGRVIFQQGALSQGEGGLEAQIHQTLIYEHLFDKVTGASLNPNMLNHKVPTTLDIHQDKHRMLYYEGDDACGPYGCSGLGEPVSSSGVSLAEAIYNAIGIWIVEAPITPQVILKALGKA